MSRLYYDSEFTRLHRNSTLISIAFISETGNYFYAEFNDYDKKQVDDWIHKHVISNLIHPTNDTENFSYLVKNIASNSNGHIKQYNIEMVDNSKEIKTELYKWIKNEVTLSNEKQVQIYTDCYTYDWMLLVELLSNDDLKSAMGMPDFINYIPIDLSSVLWSHGIDPDISREEFAGISEGDKDLMNISISATPELSSSKHNAFFDTMVCKACFEKLDKTILDPMSSK